MLESASPVNKPLVAYLYFGELDDGVHMLLSLSFRHKRGGKSGLEEQDEHIASAQRRFESWAQTRRAK